MNYEFADTDGRVGRDDRVLGDHGRDARFPFLDESVVEFLRTTPLEYVVSLFREAFVQLIYDFVFLFSFRIITDLRQPHGVGDKRILRQVRTAHVARLERERLTAFVRVLVVCQAALCLGLGECSSAKKQAIQFGSRIAKLGDAPRR